MNMTTNVFHLHFGSSEADGSPRVNLRDYVKVIFVQYWKTYVFALLVSLLCWGGNALTSNVRVDVEHFISNPGTMQGWLTIGRWGQLVLKTLLGNLDFNPYYAGVLFLVVWPLSAVTWLLLFEACRGRKLRGRWLFLLAYLVAHWWSYIFYFSMMSAEIAIGLLIIPISTALALGSFWLSNGLKKCMAILAASVLLVFVFALYQALVPATISGMALALLFLSLRYVSSQGSPTDYIKRCLLILGVFLASYIIYSAISETYFTSTDYLSSQVVWKERGFGACAYDLLRYVWHVISCRAPGSTGLFTLGLISSVITYVMTLLNGRRCRGCSMSILALSLITYMIVLISPFLLSIYMGQAPLARSQFSAPIVSATLILLAFDEIVSLSTARLASLASSVLAIAVLVLSVYSTSLIQRDLYTDDVRFQQESAFAGDVLGDLDRLYGGRLKDVPVAFVGKWSAPLNPACRRDDMWGRTLFEHDYMYLGNKAYNTSRISGFIQAVYGVSLVPPSVEQQKAAVAMSEEMTIYPEPGSIVMRDGIIVVRLED